MERKVGEVFTYNDKTYQVVEVDKGVGCKGCAFETCDCSRHILFLGKCHSACRIDCASVIFKLINNNMEIKNNQLTIDIPEGMEIDLENSDLAKGIVKFKKKNITYEDIVNSFNPTARINVFVHSDNINRLRAIAQLMNIAKYYNKDWKPNWSGSAQHKYFITYNKSEDAYSVDYNISYTYSNMYFSTKENAISVIFNPNFRPILDAIYKNE